jgi:succinylglutamate desuccinylase
MIEKVIGKGTEYETPYYVFNSDILEPVVLIEAGIHGDEVAGIYALDRLLQKIKVLSGTLIIFPRMNILACNADKRYINKDLNAVFPGKDDAAYEFNLAKEIYEMVAKEKVQYLLTLHESKHLYDVKKPGTIAQTIIYGVKPMPAYLSQWLDSVNQLTTNDKESFHSLYFPKENSSTEIMVDAYNLKGGFCIETWRGFELERRIELQTNIIFTFFETINFKYV